MDASDWIGVSLAILTFLGVIVALNFGIRSIKQTEKIWRRQFNHMLLKEVIDWTERVAEIGIPPKSTGRTVG